MSSAITKTRVALLVAAIFALVFASFARAFADDGEYREWKDKSGKRTIKAALISQGGKMVELRREDGKTIAVEIAKLSKEDQEYLKGGANSASDGAKGSSSAFAMSGPTLRVDALGRDVYFPDPKAPKEIVPTDKRMLWRVEPTEIEPKKLENGAKFTLFRGPKGAKGTKSNRKVFALRDGGFVCGLTLGAPEDAGCDSYLEYVGDDDQSVGAFPLSIGDSRLIDVDPDCRVAISVAPRLEDKAKRSGFLLFTDVAGLKEGRPVSPIAAFCPYPRRGQKGIEGCFDVRFARYLGKGLFATWKNGDGLTVWDADGCVPKYAIKAGSQSAFALEPSRKYFAIAEKCFIVFYRASSGEPIGRYPYADPNYPEVQAPRIAFSPNGLKLAVATERQTRIVDLKTGKTTGKLPTGLLNGGELLWSDDSHVLVEGICYDLENEFPLCLYAGIRGAFSARGAICRVKNSVLTAFELPHETVRAIDVKGLNLSDEFDLYPGADVQVKLDLGGNQTEDSTLSSFKSKVFERGFNYVSKADVTLSATCEVVDHEKILLDITEVESDPENLIQIKKRESEVTVNVYEQRLAVEKGDQVLYERKNRQSVSSIISVRGDQTPEEAILADNKVRLGFFISVLPKYIAKNGTLGAYVRATLMDDGTIVDGKSLEELGIFTDGSADSVGDNSEE
ncbi:MAG: hypothetical protein IJM30_00035 [Thermoguttaceae bacterium]|nr:hypothetical protein [Thermoguttaceae bacterium]